MEELKILINKANIVKYFGGNPKKIFDRIDEIAKGMEKDRRMREYWNCQPKKESYKIVIYDPLIKKTLFLAELPERRIGKYRPKGRLTVENWLRSVFGKEWFKKNKNLIGIHKR